MTDRPIWPPACDGCGDVLDRPGALLFGPPDQETYVQVTTKRHLCRDCFMRVLCVVQPIRAPEPDIPPGLAPLPTPERPEPKFKIGDRVQAANINGPSMIVGRTWVGTFWLYEMDTDEEVPEDLLRPAPAPERPEPKFKVGDRVTHRNFAEPQEIRSCVWDGVKWTHEFVGRDGWWHEANLTAAPEPSIPIGGWFDPGDGRTLQRIDAASKETWASAFVFSDAASADFVFFPVSQCSPLTEREAMERLYPAGTWLRSAIGSNVIVAAHNDTDRPVKVLFNGDPAAFDTVRWAWLKRCTVLPGPPLPAPWRPLDELPTDWPDGKLLLVIDTEGKYRMRGKIDVRMYPSQFEAWADLDDVAPIPAHLRGGA